MAGKHWGRAREGQGSFLGWRYIKNSWFSKEFQVRGVVFRVFLIVIE